MALRNVLKDGDETLNKHCREIVVFDERLFTLLDDLTDTMRENDGAGLAAPQVGILRRAVVVDAGDGKVIELLNPVIIKAEGENAGVEGCISVPGVWGIVKRPQKVLVRALDRSGKAFEVEGEGMLARAFCHEIDHLDGILFTSKVSEYVNINEYRGKKEREGLQNEDTVHGDS